MFASDLKIQCDWMKIELPYGHLKVPGFDEKLRRIRISQTNPQSVMNFMGSYWSRFQQLSVETTNTQTPHIVQHSLQVLGKLPNGLTDKVAMILWMEGINEYDSLNQAVDLVRAHARKQHDFPASIYRKLLVKEDFTQTVMAMRINEIHNLITKPDYSKDQLLHLAVENAVHGLHIWSAYMEILRKNKLFSDLPQPGLPSGEVKTWVR